MRHLLFFSTLIVFCSCKTGKFQNFRSQDKHFISAYDQAHGGRDSFTFKANNSFVYYGTGPTTFFSRGQWKYDADSKEIILKSDSSLRTVSKNPIDTIWVDFNLERVTILSKKKLKCMKIIYYLQ